MYNEGYASRLGQEIGNVFAISHEFAHHAGGYVGVLRLGEEEDGFHAAQTVVHGGDVALVLEVLDGTEAAQDESGSFAARQVNGEVFVGNYLDARLGGVEPTDDFHTLFGGVEGTLPVVDPDPDNDAVEHGQSALDDAGVAYGEGVEGPRENCCLHFF